MTCQVYSQCYSRNCLGFFWGRAVRIISWLFSQNGGSVVRGEGPVAPFGSQNWESQYFWWIWSWFTLFNFKAADCLGCDVDYSTPFLLQTGRWRGQTGTGRLHSSLSSTVSALPSRSPVKCKRTASLLRWIPASPEGQTHILFSVFM